MVCGGGGGGSLSGRCVVTDSWIRIRKRLGRQGWSWVRVHQRRWGWVDGAGWVSAVFDLTTRGEKWKVWRLLSPWENCFALESIQIDSGWRTVAFRDLCEYFVICFQPTQMCRTWINGRSESRNCCQPRGTIASTWKETSVSYTDKRCLRPLYMELPPLPPRPLPLWEKLCLDSFKSDL